MLTLRQAQARGRSRYAWLDSHHSFSFADYVDPDHMGFSVLRVINEDHVAPAAGFPTHGHRDMEIISYVLEGELEHKDSLGNGSVIRAGEVQRMSAGTGIRHSEYNASATEPLSFLQIWVLPARDGITPGYEQQQFFTPGEARTLRLVVSPDGRQGSLSIHQDVCLYVGRLSAGTVLAQPLASGRRAYVHLARGAMTVNGQALHGGDAVAMTDETAVEMAAGGDSEVLVFDLP
jgi:redox-sensitive bicupin YhaK (pirin superfamily)